MTSSLNKITQQATEQQSADRALLEYLKPKPGDRYSKLEAYCDLLSRSSSAPYVAKHGGQTISLLPGQFITTISTLAKKWNWQRATVRQFLAGLVETGQIAQEKFYKSYIFSIRHDMKMTLDIRSMDDILDFCMMQFTRFREGRVSSQEVANSYETYYGMMMQVAREHENEQKYEEQVYLHQAHMFDMLAYSIASHVMFHKLGKKSHLDAVFLLFGRNHLWNWQKVIDVLGLLNTAFRQLTTPSLLGDRPPFLTKAELSLLDSIYSYYATTMAKP